MARADGTLIGVRVAYLLCALSASAPAAEVILVADGAQGSRVVQQLRTEAVNGVRVAGGYPRVMKSEEISGLKPGRLVTFGIASRDGKRRTTDKDEFKAGAAESAPLTVRRAKCRPVAAEAW